MSNPANMSIFVKNPTHPLSCSSAEHVHRIEQAIDRRGLEVWLCPAYLSLLRQKPLPPPCTSDGQGDTGLHMASAAAVSKDVNHLDLVLLLSDSRALTVGSSGGQRLHYVSRLTE